MLAVLAKVVFTTLSALPEDDLSQDLVFKTEVEGTVEDLHDAIVAFYNDASVVSADSIAHRLGAFVSRGAGASEVRYYGIPDAPGDTGSPFLTIPWTLDAQGAGFGADMPGEVALALSFNADLTGIPEVQPNPDPPPATIRPAARRRGRIFLGTWPVGANTTDAAGRVRPSGSTTNVVMDSGFEFLGEQAQAAGWSHCVWSRTDWEAYPVVNYSVDNAWDTIRVRGAEPTLRIERSS